MSVPRPALWDVFCTVIDNHGDLGVCWRLARQLQRAGHTVRLWVDDASALAWMAPEAARGPVPGITVLPWAQATDPQALARLPRGDVWVEAFGCHLPEAFVAHGVALTGHGEPPRWINLEYLSAEDWVPRMHGLPSPVMTGPARGWTKRFIYPGFTPDTGGLLRETDLAQQQAAFDRTAWRAAHAPERRADAWLISLFCYEPPGLPDWLAQLSGTDHHLLVTPGRALSAVHTALCAQPPVAPALRWTALNAMDQVAFDHLLWACDLNFVRGEDSLVRALWAGQPLVWHIYPQDDQAHHAKLEAFLTWLQAPPSLRHFHRVWNGITQGPLPTLDKAMHQAWADCIRAARQRLWDQPDLLSGLTA